MTAAVGGPVTPDTARLRYEIVFDCRDRVVGDRLCTQLEELLRDRATGRRGEEGPSWSLTLEFEDATAADEFFRGDGYRAFCVEVRRSSQSSVLVVPLGTPTEPA